MECKMHIDVFVEVQIRVCLSWEYQENQHGWQPQSRGDRLVSSDLQQREHVGIFKEAKNECLAEVDGHC